MTVLLDLPEGPAVAGATVVWAAPAADEEGRCHGLRIREMAPTHEVRWREFLVRMASQTYSRRHGRLGVRLQIQCAVLGRPPRELRGRTVDLSPGGVQLLLPEAVPVGTRLNLSLQVPMGPRALEGEVVWCTPAEGGSTGWACSSSRTPGDGPSSWTWRSGKARVRGRARIGVDRNPVGTYR